MLFGVIKFKVIILDRSCEENLRFLTNITCTYLANYAVSSINLVLEVTVW